MPPASECTCPVEHTVAKLGHCRTCAAYDLRHQSTVKMPPDVSLFVCGSLSHADGTPHDFDWATYADDDASYGVCRCGYDALSDALLRNP